MLGFPWNRTRSLIGLIAAAALLGVAVHWLLRSRIKKYSRSNADESLSGFDDGSDADGEAGHIPLNDETRRRLRQVVDNDPDQAAEIIKQWIRGAA